MEKVFVGKIVNTFGIKGELKIANSFEWPEKVFQKEVNILINNESFKITKVRYHKNHYLVEINDLNDINLVEKYKGLDIYILKSSLDLQADEYLMNDLIGLDVYDNNELIGQVTEIINHPVNPLIKVNNQFYIPMKAHYIQTVDLKDKCIKGKNIKELML